MQPPDLELVTGPARALAARGDLSGRFGRPRLLGGPCRPADGAAPVVTPAGLAPAWTDALARTGISLFGSVFESSLRRGRLHVALGPELAAPVPPPRIRLSIPPAQVLGPHRPLRVLVACDRACDLRATVPTRGGERAAGTAELAARGRVALAIDPATPASSLRAVAAGWACACGRAGGTGAPPSSAARRRSSAGPPRPTARSRFRELPARGRRAFRVVLHPRGRPLARRVQVMGDLVEYGPEGAAERSVAIR